MKKITITKKISAFPLQSNTGFNILTTRPEYEETSGTGSNGYDRNVSTIRSFWKDGIDNRIRSYNSINALNFFNLSQSQVLSNADTFYSIHYDTSAPSGCYPAVSNYTSSIYNHNIRNSIWSMDNTSPTLNVNSYSSSYQDLSCSLYPTSSYYYTEYSSSKTYASSFIKGDLAPMTYQEIIGFISQPSGTYTYTREAYTDGYKNTAGFNLAQIEYFQYATSSYIPIPRATFVYTNVLPRHFTYSFHQNINNGYIYKTDEISGKKPFYNSYNEFSSDFSVISKNYSILPEYIVSNHMEDYILNGFKKTDNYNYLDVYGKTDEYVEKLENNVELSSSYNTTEILSDLSYDSYSYNLEKIKINCESIIKLLPYNNFYPQQKSLNIVDTFQKSYFDINIQDIFSSNPTTNILNDVTGSTLNTQIQTVLQPLFAPGILFNSIKSGLGVSFPTFITSSVNYSSSNKPEFYEVYDREEFGRGKYGGLYEPQNAPLNDTNYYVISKNFNKKVLFENLLDIDSAFNVSDIENNYCLYYLSPTSYYKPLLDKEERYPLYSLKSNSKLKNKNGLKSKDDRYKLNIHNFLSEIVNMFIDNSSLTEIVSKTESEFGVFNSGSTYMMDIALQKADKNLKMYVFSTGSLSSSANLFLGMSPATLFGPPSSIIADGNSYSGSFYQWFSVSDAAFKPYLPAYYFGSSLTRVKFIPEETREYSAKEIVEKLQFENILTQDDRNAFKDAYGGVEYYSLYSGSVANQNTQTILDSFNISITKDRNLTLNQEQGNILSNVSQDRISIQSKFECPILNFNTTENLSNAVPTFVNDNTFIVNYSGIWSGYGEIPSDDSLIYISINNVNAETNTTSSLIDKCFQQSNSKKTIGKLKNTHELSEAIVLIPYTFITDSQYADTVMIDLENGIDQGNLQYNNIKPHYLKINRDTINTLLNEDDKQSRILLSNETYINNNLLNDIYNRIKTKNSNNSILNCMKNMQNYVLPPHLDWLRDSKIHPFAMYFIEFNEVLSRQDLSDIWQGLMPSASNSFKLKNSSIEHELGNNEFYHGKKIQPDIRFKMFKVKKRAKTNYYELTSDLEDDRKFTAKFGDGNEIVPLYSYNWPHDHYSLIQGSKVTVELQLSKEQE